MNMIGKPPDKQGGGNQEQENYELKMALELSMEEHIKQNIILSNDRKKSLESFLKKLRGLSHTPQDIEIKTYIDSVLFDYFELNMDFIYVEDDMYEKMYKIIDTYYLIPNQKKMNKTAISEDEDHIIRSIFLRKYFI